MAAPEVSSSCILSSSASVGLGRVEAGVGACGGGLGASSGLRLCEERPDNVVPFFVTAMDGNYARAWVHFFSEVANRFPPSSHVCCRGLQQCGALDLGYNSRIRHPLFIADRGGSACKTTCSPPR